MQLGAAAFGQGVRVKHPPQTVLQPSIDELMKLLNELVEQRRAAVRQNMSSFGTGSSFYPATFDDQQIQAVCESLSNLLCMSVSGARLLTRATLLEKKTEEK